MSDRPGHDRRYAVDPTDITSELGWQPRHSVQEGLAATVHWYLEQQGRRRVSYREVNGDNKLGVLTDTN